ncbi:MAG: HEPN domain-containing protein [Pseudomonadota bacterium]
MRGRDPGALEQWREARRWFDIADEDLRTARICLTGQPPALASAAYHCQQTAEKLIKGLLVAAAVSFPKTHSLRELANLAAPYYPSLTGVLDVLQPLTLWGFSYRYPSIEEDADEAPKIEEVAKAIQQLSDSRVRIASLDPTDRPR